MFHDDDPDDEIQNTALVCRNGHVINDARQLSPNEDSEFCSDCGAPAVGACSKCSEPVRGRLVSRGVFITAPFIPPSFCRRCGTPFPWTESRLAAANEVIEDSGLSQEDKAAFAAALPELTRDTPLAQAKAGKVSKILGRAGKEVADTVKQIVIGVITESVRLQIWPK